MAQRGSIPGLLMAAALLALAVPAHAELPLGVDEDAPLHVHRFAVVVGTNLGGAGRSPLRFAVRDAQAMALVLQELGGVWAADLTLLEDPLVSTLVDLSPRMGASAAARRELLVSARRAPAARASRCRRSSSPPSTGAT
jgi:hypothetical protein